MTSEGIYFLELYDSVGKAILREGSLDKLPEDFKLRKEENFATDGFRNAFRKNENGSVRIVFDDGHELLQGNKAVQRACFIYLTLIPKIKQIESGHRQSFEAVIRRFAHNLVKLQTRFKDNFTRLVPEGFRGKPFEEMKLEVKRRIESDFVSAAYDVCQMSHRATDLDAQIETLRIISGLADSSGSMLSTNLHKALYRLTNPFFDELAKKGVHVTFNIQNASTEKVKVVHELFNAAMWQFFDNASKYVLKDTDISISAELNSEKKKLIINMVSISIDEDELEDIFRENFRGRNVHGTDGTGIGMYIAKKALKLMRADISVKNDGFVIEMDGHRYSRHIFEIHFSD